MSVGRYDLRSVKPDESPLLSPSMARRKPAKSARKASASVNLFPQATKNPPTLSPNMLANFSKMTTETPYKTRSSVKARPIDFEPQVLTTTTQFQDSKYQFDIWTQESDDMIDAVDEDTFDEPDQDKENMGPSDVVMSDPNRKTLGEIAVASLPAYHGLIGDNFYCSETEREPRTDFVSFRILQHKDYQTSKNRVLATGKRNLFNSVLPSKAELAESPSTPSKVPTELHRSKCNSSAKRLLFPQNLHISIPATPSLVPAERMETPSAFLPFSSDDDHERGAQWNSPVTPIAQSSPCLKRTLDGIHSSFKQPLMCLRPRPTKAPHTFAAEHAVEIGRKKRRIRH